MTLVLDNVPLGQSRSVTCYEQCATGLHPVMVQCGQVTHILLLSTYPSIFLRSSRKT